MAAVRQAVDLGVNFFDTADVYGLGRSEELLARALGQLRHQVVIATKGGVVWEGGRSIYDTRPKYLAQALEGSLRRLKVEQVSLYYVHWPDRRTPLAETMEALSRLKRQGKIGCIGISNFNSDELDAAGEGTDACQDVLNFLEQEAARSTMPRCRDMGISFISASSLAQGLLTGKYGSDTHFDADDSRCRAKKFQSPDLERNLEVVGRIREVTRRLGRTATQVALRWLFDGAQVDCALTGIKSVAQLTENVGALGWSLDQASLRYLAVGEDQDSVSAC